MLAPYRTDERSGTGLTQGGLEMRKIVVAATLVAALAAPTALQAQFAIGGQGSWSTDTDWGVGARVSLDARQYDLPLLFTGAFDYFWPEEGAADLEYWEINVNASYLRTLAPQLSSYAGIGLNVAHGSAGLGDFEASGTEYGLNLQAGSRYSVGKVVPFFETRFEIAGGEQFIITLGLEFLLGG
jgi:hypothetical protein